MKSITIIIHYIRRYEKHLSNLSNKKYYLSNYKIN